MALATKMHTLTFTPITEDTDASSVVQIPGGGAGVEVAGQLTPMNADAAFRATGLELNRPHLWLCDDTDAPSIKPKYPATQSSTGRKFTVVSPNEIWNAIPAQAFMSCVLEEKEIVV